MLIYDLADPQELTGYVRGVQMEMEKNTFTLSQILPNDNIDDIEYRYMKGQFRDQDAASVRAWDTESPIGSRQGVSRVMGELPPISKKMRLGEEERLRKRALETGSNAGLINAIYDDAGNMARAVAARVELLRGEALEDGQIAINENGVVQTVSFGRNAAHDPAALSGTAKWDDHTNSTPIQNIQAWQNTYVSTNGIKPAAILTSTDIIGDLLLNSQIRSLAASLSGTPAMVTLDTVRAALSAFGLPPIYTYDTKVRVNGSQDNVLDPTKVFFIPPKSEPLGKTFFGTTAESLELAGAKQIANDQCPGMVAVVDKTFDPVGIWTKAVAIALPVLANPDLTFVVKVK